VSPARRRPCRNPAERRSHRSRRHPQPLDLDLYGAITLAQARSLALEQRVGVAKRLDPHTEKRKAAKEATTVKQAAEAYLADLLERAETGAKRGKRSSWATAKRRVEKHIFPLFGDRPLRDVQDDDVIRLHRSLHATPGEANRTVGALSAIFGYAEGRFTPQGFNPCRAIEPYPEMGKRRALTPGELEALGTAMHAAEQATKKGERVGPSALLALRFLALTGFRRSELLGHMSKERRGQDEGLRWGDVDLVRGIIRLRTTKAGGPQERVIGAAATELLKSAKPRSAKPDDPVCPGDEPGQPFVGIDRPRRRLFKAAGLDGLPGVDLYSLRHSFASIGAHVLAFRRVRWSPTRSRLPAAKKRHRRLHSPRLGEAPPRGRCDRSGDRRPTRAW
jgi:integrase